MVHSGHRYGPKLQFRGRQQPRQRKRDTDTNNKDTTRTQQFIYDHLNRILTAETTSTHATSPANCWGETYVYDNNTTSAGEFGNLTNINAASSAYTGCTQESLSVTALTSNQLSAKGFSYDTSGNILTDGHNTYGWNAESEIKSAAGVNYTYDGDGNRVQKSNGKIYWYGAGTEILDESDASGSFSDEYVYFGGKRIAHRVVSGNSIYYYAEDFLATSRVITTSTGTVCYESDFYPYGGERNITNTCPQNYKFEGKERDTETNNDDFGARYYSSQFGRWTSPDWSSVPAPVPYANLSNPQTLNLYAMVSDNPETFADLDGHELCGPACHGAAAGGGGGWAGDFDSTNYNDNDAIISAHNWTPIANQLKAQNTGEGSQANVDRRAAIADAAQAHENDTSMPYTAGHATCNLFCQRAVAESGRLSPKLRKLMGRWALPRLRNCPETESLQAGDFSRKANLRSRETLLHEKSTLPMQPGTPESLCP
jgi:RHS repeat-associated protein